MSKTPKIRWRESDLNELQRVINNFNARLARQQNNNPDAQYLPSKMKKKEAMESIYSRKDFNRLIKDLEKFNAKTAEKVSFKSQRGSVETTQWQYDKFKREQRAVNKEREKLRKKLEPQEVKRGGEGTGYTKASMSSFKEVSVLPDTKTPAKMTQKEWDNAVKLMDARMRSDYNLDKKRKMLENYIKGLIRQGYSDKLIEMMSSIDPEVFYERIDLDTLGGFEFIYDLQDLRDKEEEIRGAWEDYADTASSNINVNELEAVVNQEIEAGYFGRHVVDMNRTPRKKKDG